VVVANPGIFEQFIGGLFSMLARLIILIFMTYFLLISGESWLIKISRLGRSWPQRRRIAQIAQLVEQSLSRYLATVSLINICLGAATSFVMYLLDVPNPILWGAMAAIFNFAPYVGAVASAFVLLLVGLMTFPELTDALKVPGAFLILTIIEGQLITPLIVGRWFFISPMLIFISVIFWGWIWGVAGALMAVPIVAAFRIICGQVPRFYFLGELLSNSPAPIATLRERLSP
jgi:predicted PurR-regulated permease PerM